MRTEYILTLTFLAIYAVTDVKRRTVFWPLGGAMLPAALLLHLLFRDMAWQAMLLGMVPGGVMALISLLTGGAVGAGDCLAAAVCGSMLGLDRIITALTFSMILACVPAAFLLIKKGRKAHKDQLPYLPFLLAGQILCLLLEYRGG